MRIRNLYIGSVIALSICASLFIFLNRAHALTTITPPNLFKIGGTQIMPLYPTWSINIPLSFPGNFSAASSTTGGSLSTSSSPIYFMVSALNSTGTTTPSTELSTTTSTGSSRIHFSWTPVPGATGYAVFYSTTTPGAENAYQIASTTNQYDFTSTSSPAYAKPPGFSTAFGVQLSNGTSSIAVNGVNIAPFATSTPAIGGGALAAGACTTSTSTLAYGYTVSSSTIFMTTPQKFPGNSVVWNSYALSSTQVVTQVCALTAITPVSTAYNLRVF